MLLRAAIAGPDGLGQAESHGDEGQAMDLIEPDEDWTAADQAARRWKGLLLVSGILLILNAALSLVLAYSGRILYSSGYPSDPAAYLQLVARHQRLAAVTWAGWIIVDILPLPVIVAMYVVLQRHNRTLALLGSLLAVFYAIYDVSATELNSLTLVSLAHGYANAPTEALKAPLVAAATYGYHALPLQTVLSFALGPLAYLLWCVPMARSFFGRRTAVIGAVVSLIGLVGSASPVVPSSILVGWCFFLAPRLIALWTVLLGVQLFRYGRGLCGDKLAAPAT
jgi:hypothetical protein